MPLYTYTTIDDPLGTGGAAVGINDAGQVVGGYIDATNHEHGFLYSGGNFTTLALGAKHLCLRHQRRGPDLRGLL
jgi:probable HAF family extracellular repeat protein